MFNEAKKIELLELLEKYPPSIDKCVNYGTAGFRMNSEYLDWIVLRMGFLSALRAINTNSAIGLMITASHNPPCDNGVKIIDPEGEMLNQDWETLASDLVKYRSPSECFSFLIRNALDFDNSPRTKLTAEIILGYDTRHSSPTLAKIAENAALCCGIKVQVLGLVTTPQLHFIVRCRNNGTYGYYGEPSEHGYFTKLATAFCSFLEFHAIKTLSEIIVDCANGVGARTLKTMIDYIGKKGCHFPVKLQNTEITDQNLNNGCGADYVKISHKLPRDVTPEKNELCCTFDGDADRILYFFIDESENFCLIDGDKLAALAATYISRLVKHTGVDLTVGVVLTAYSNMRCVKYIEDVLKLPVVITHTGVKHLHAMAKTFDAGIYFEANGHGTILFSEKFESAVGSIAQHTSIKKRQALLKLKYLMQMTNKTVGDAISNFLLFAAIVHVLKMSVYEFYEVFNALPNVQLKVHVPNRYAVKVNGPDCVCVEPIGLQDSISKILKPYGPEARAFVRPSGTEDVVRIYAEASTTAEAKAIVDLISAELKKFLSCKSSVIGDVKEQ